MKNKFTKSALALIMIASFLGCSSNDDSQTTTPPPAVVAKTKVSITKIEVSQIPQNDSNGLNWDIAISPNNNPDVYIKLLDENNNVGYTTNHVSNVIPSISNPLSVQFSDLSTTNLANSVLKVQVWDDDIHDSASSSDDKIGEVPFYIYDYTIGNNKYPSFAVKSDNGTIVTIYMTWE